MEESKQFMDESQLKHLEVILKKYLEPEMDCGDLIQQFVEAKKLECCSSKTIEQYGERLRFYERMIKKDLRMVTKEDIRTYLSEYQSRGISSKTLNNMRLYLSTFYKWLEDEDIITKSPMRSIKAIKITKVVKKPFTNIEILKIRKSCNNNYRNVAIVESLLSTGCRISELASLKISDIHDDEAVIYGKGGKERLVYFSDEALYAINNYLNIRNDSSDYLFVSSFQSKATRLTTNSFRRILKDIGTRANVENVHPHRFRRTVATNLLNSGMPVQEVATILGHAKIETTMIYCNVNQSMVKNDHKKYL